MEQMPCQYYGRYYGHSVACFSNSIVSSAERAIFSEISRQHNNLLHDCEKEIDSLKSQLAEAKKTIDEMRK
jgi:hypothetical protein